MTEEEKRKQQEQGGMAASPDTPASTSDGAQAKGGAADAEDTVPAWKTAADGLRRRAESYREYSRKPVETDTEGQRDYVREFINSRLARQQETDEERERREQRERTGRRLSALADGLIALSNVTGAMFGATPLKQTSLTAAHKKGVQEALKHRMENAKQYEVARNSAMKLQQKQDEDNAKRRDAEVKARRAAARQADTLEEKAARLELQGGKADNAHNLAKEKAKAAKAHQQEQERQGRQRIALSQERNDISRSKGGRNGGGNGSSQADFDEYARWEREYPEEVGKIRTDNAQINPYTKQPEKSVTTTTVKLVNAKMRQRYGTPGRKTSTQTSRPKKKSVQGFGGGGKSTGKKKIAEFGK